MASRNFDWLYRTFAFSFVLENIRGWAKSFICIFQHQRFVSEAAEKEPEVVFIGDSLLANMLLTEVCCCMPSLVRCARAFTSSALMCRKHGRCELEASVDFVGKK